MKTHSLIAITLTLYVSATRPGMAQENIGTHRQPLVNGLPVSQENQEYFGLLSYIDAGSSCSASLLRNNWVITAAHCVEAKDLSGNPIPDPVRPRQNMLKPVAAMQLIANWKTTQVKNGVRVITFRPYDVAIIEMDTPFRVGGSTTSYSALIFQDGQFPYWGEPVGANLLVFGQGINVFASGSGSSATPSSSDGLFRMTYAKPTENRGYRYWYPSENNRMIAGGDSGGPSFAWVLSGYALVGVHSAAITTRLPGKIPNTGWTWVTSVSEAGDAPIAPVFPQILSIIGPPPPQHPDLTGPHSQTGNVGTFAPSIPNYSPMWVYGIKPDGNLIWYRKETETSAWRGPKTVGTGWTGFKDVIAAGGNRFYALSHDGKLLWYQHQGFNDGSFKWLPAKEVGTGWDFKHIFSGGDGIVYAIRKDGHLIWYRNTGYKDGSKTWAEHKDIGTGWADFKDVFSLGSGAIYAVRKDGALVFYSHRGFANGENQWSNPRIVGTGWENFLQIVPVGDGVILAVRSDGTLLRYKHRGVINKSGLGFGRLVETWDPPVRIGSGWQTFGKVFALMPATPDDLR